MDEVSPHSATNTSVPAVKAVLFDLDGVVIDSEPLHVRALELTCRYFGFPLREDDVPGFRGLTEAKVANHIVSNHQAAGITSDDFINHKSRIYTRLIHDELTLIDGVVDYMQRCRATGLRLALTTSALPENTESVLQKFQLGPYFDVIVTSREVVHSKPHPEPYLITAQKLNIDPRDCQVIEDSINGVLSGKAAGCRVIGITTSFPASELISAGADAVINAYAEMGAGFHL